MEPPALKGELKSVTTMPGVLSVMTCGLLMMQMWYVGSLDSVALVSSISSQHRLDMVGFMSSMVGILSRLVMLVILPYRYHCLDWEQGCRWHWSDCIG